VKTSDLNRWLAHAVAKHPPPAVDGKRIKPRYITQIKARPPTFVLMSSRAAKIPETYKRYLVSGIREAFGMQGLPVRLHIRQNRNPYADAKE
jgi:GTP-binding protein